MSSAPRLPQRQLLSFASLVETATGAALVVAPAFVIKLLLGAGVWGTGVAVGRVAGLVMLALGFAGWPSPPPADSSAAFRGLLFYNASVALYLAFLGTVRHVGGLLLWPAVVLHGAVALLLVWTWRTGRAAPR